MLHPGTAGQITKIYPDLRVELIAIQRDFQDRGFPRPHPPVENRAITPTNQTGEQGLSFVERPMSRADMRRLVPA